MKFMLLSFGILATNFCISQTSPNKNTSKNSDSASTNTIKLPGNNPKLTLKIFPNPATNKISLQVTGFNPGLVMVKIVDEKGVLHSNDNRLLTTNDNEINMFLQLPKGIYYVSIIQQNKAIKKRLMVL